MRHAAREHAVDVGGERELELRVEGQHLEPRLDRSSSRDDLAQPLARVVEEEPAACGIGGQDDGRERGRPRRDELRQRHLVP